MRPAPQPDWFCRMHTPPPSFLLLNKIRFSLLFITLLLLTACTTLAPVPEIDKNNSWQLHQARLDGLTNWELAGRIAVQMENEGWSASLYWRQDQSNYSLRVVAPLGKGTVEISGDADSVRLQTADNRIFENSDVAALMQENLGWEIPVDALIYWIRGLPDPDVATTGLEIDSMGRLTLLKQSEWDVSYEKYTNTDDYELPARMTVQRDQLKLRLSINKWTLK